MVDISRDIQNYRDYDVYVLDQRSYNFVLYKPKGKTISSVRLINGSLPEELYVSVPDKTHYITSKQKSYNSKLKYVLKKNPLESKKLLSHILDISASTPEPEVFDQMKETIDLVLDEYLADSNVVKRLIEVTTKDFSTSVHSVNVMLYCLRYARQCNFAYKDLKLFGLMGLLHDVGKVRLPNEILTAPRKLTEQEYEEIKKHPLYGWQILRQSKLNSKIQVAALEHHERPDGSGYPNGLTSKRISPASKALAMADVYEALTNWRPYKSPVPALKALDIIKKDVLQNKMDEKTFIIFAKSLIGDK
ncbi:MAG TPA: HD domain-containing phosphohydrolase [Desulfobacteria bacterium]|nr:HD domain-containing phosphohydrolase [Desulfobacteria bacterium]